MKECNCEMCQMSRRVRAVYKDLPEEVQSVIDDLWNL